jgi:two-component system, OmpR family, sensor histidine kinase BaeS
VSNDRLFFQLFAARPLRIVHQLSLLLAAAVLLAVTALSTAVAWNLRSGFSDYLGARDQAELDRLAQQVALRYANEPQLQTLRSERSAMRELIDGLVPAHVHEQRAEETSPALMAEQRGPPRHVLQLAHIVDVDGAHLAGPPMPAGTNSLRSAVRIGGATVAYAELPRAPRLEAVDAQFLQRQYLGLALVAALTLLAAGVIASVAARHWSRPLRDIKSAAQRIAQGEFTVALPRSHTQEIGELAQAIGRMAQSLQTLEGARRRWLAQVSHELRTPLAVLRGEIESLHEGVRTPTPQLLSGLREQVTHLARLVSDLHTLAIADLGGMPCSFDWGDAGPWLQRSAQRYEALATQAGLRLQIEVAADAQKVQVYWDFDRMAQVLGALLDNSLRYTQAPGRVWVRCKADTQAHRWRIDVCDSAPAVPTDDLSQLFEPLFRSGRTPQRGHREGSGLGLAIAKSIVIAHGGTINANLSPLGGLTVSVDLPWEAR